MLNFAEQTGSGAVMLVWSFSLSNQNFVYIKYKQSTQIFVSEAENRYVDAKFKSHLLSFSCFIKKKITKIASPQNHNNE
jgi:hypothetical protein